MNTLAADEIRNVAKHLNAILDCMAQARETLSYEDYVRFLQVMINELALEGELREITSSGEQKEV